MKYKLLACDLDGTLLDDDSNVSAENLNAIDEMVKLGVEFAICTGRTYDEIPKALLDNKSIRYIIYSDGSGDTGGTAGQQHFQKEKAAGRRTETRRGTGKADVPDL